MNLEIGPTLALRVTDTRRLPGQEGNSERVQPFLVRKRIQSFIPTIIALLLRRACIRDSENASIKQSFAFIDFGPDPINPPDCTKGINHLIGNQLNGLVCVWNALHGADLFNCL